MKPRYYKYDDSQYIVLDDGTVARTLKETKIHNQTYYNLIIDGKMKRVNKEKLMEPFSEVNDEDLNA
jgi:hypothetical protein